MKPAHLIMLALASSAGCEIDLESPSGLEHREQAVVYGTDDRVNVRRHASQALRTAAQSVMLVTDKSSVVELPFLPIVQLASSDRGLCSDQAFAEERSAGSCTAFLIAPDRLVTSGHCLDANDNKRIDGTEKDDFCEDARFVLDHLRLADADDGSVRTTTIFPSQHVFQCARLLHAQYDKSRGIADFAVIQLDRPTLRPGLPTDPNARARLARGDDLVVIGHPYGLPMKIDDGGEVAAVGRNGNLFSANTDTFGGNSGSPVLDDQGRVIGILTAGVKDFDDDPDGCKNIATHPDSLAGERITHIAALERWADAAEPNDDIGSAKRRPPVFRAAEDGAAGHRVLRAGLGNGEGPGFLRITANDDDYFAIPAIGGDIVDIRVRFAHAGGDIDVELTDLQGARLGVGVSIDDDETLSVHVPGVGLQPVILEVWGHRGATNDYALEVTLRPPLGEATCDVGVPCSAGVCNPRPGMIRGLEAGRPLDLGLSPGICEASTVCVETPAGERCRPRTHVVYLPIESAHPYAHNARERWVVGLGPDMDPAVQWQLDRWDIEARFDLLALTDGSWIDGSGTSALAPDQAKPLQVRGMWRDGLELMLRTDGSVAEDGFWISGFRWTP